MKCPNCQSDRCVKNGRTHYGKQRFKCKNCHRQFVAGSQYQPISQETKDLIDRLLLERMSLAAIPLRGRYANARVTGVSIRWIQNYVNQKYHEVPREVQVTSKKKGKITIQLDEMWSFIGNKQKKCWIWLALDEKTREIVGVHVGDRSGKGAKKLWDSLPPIYRQCAVCYTDFWEAYQMVIPSKRHRPVEKESGKTSYIERLNNTLRQRISRLVRKSLSFSKKLENHIGAIWYFVHHYNSYIRARLVAIA